MRINGGSIREGEKITAVERKHLLVSCESVSTEGRLSSVDGGGRPQAIRVEDEE
jgi:hypothetical protein